MPFLFENLEVYKKAMKLVVKVYALCSSHREYSKRKLVDQIQRAVLSIPLNIAEGQGRKHDKEKKQFYNIAKGSLYECVPLIGIFLELRLIDNVQYADLNELLNDIGKLLAGLIRSLSTER